MKSIPRGVKEVGLAALVAFSLGCSGEPIKIEPIKRYSLKGEVLNLNRLEVDWRKNEKCGDINPKYGYTTGDVVYDNILRVLGDSPSYSFFKKGFSAQRAFFKTTHMSESNSPISGGMEYAWNGELPYIIESAEPDSILRQIGQQIYENACNDPELNQ